MTLKTKNDDVIEEFYPPLPGLRSPKKPRLNRVKVKQ